MEFPFTHTARAALLLAGLSFSVGYANPKARGSTRQKPSPTPELPMVGDDGVDAWGFSLKTADKITLRRLLRERRYDELTRMLEAFQRIAETDCSRELVGLDAFEAFQSADPTLEPLLDEWVRASSASYAPLVARGHYWAIVGSVRRGGKWASETTPEQWKAMADADAKARRDLEGSIRLHPTAAAYRATVNVDTRSSGVAQETIADALKICPASLQFHTKVVALMTPRWGGSYEEMLAFAAEAPVSQNPKLKVLPGFVESDLADLARSKRPEEALLHNERALSFGPYWEFQLDKAKTLLHLRRYREALEEVDRAIHQRPQKARAHATRARALVGLSRWSEAADAVAYARAIDPFDADVKGMDGQVVMGLLREASALQVSDPETARNNVDKALSLIPTSQEAMRIRGLLNSTAKTAGADAGL